MMQNRPIVGTAGDLLELIQSQRKASERLLVTIDGPCGSGKSTLADHLSRALCIPVVHMDDFSIPHKEKTPQRLAIPGGNMDVDRLRDEVLTPWLETRSCSYRPYLCHEDRLGKPVAISQADALILEGSYSNLPPIREHAAIRIFLTIAPESQQHRLLKRVGQERLRAFNERWIPLENAYFMAYHLPDDGCIVLSQDDQAE